MGEEDEESVLGIPVCDPDVLKASQFVLVSVGITAFFLVMELSQVAEQRGLRNLSTSEVILRVVDMVRALFMIVSGYVGAKRSNRCLLGLFCMITVLSCLESAGSGVYAIRQHEKAGIVALQFFSSVFFMIAFHYSRFLFVQAGVGALSGMPRRDGAHGQYEMLGVQLLDLKVLKATQMVFTSVGIVVGILGSFVIVGAESAFSSSNVRGFWLICLGICLSMMYTSYFGVKRSNIALLSCFVTISGALCSLSVVFTLVAVMACGTLCLSFVLFWAGVSVVFGVALKNAQFLRSRANTGVVLTAPCQTDSAGPAAVQIGRGEAGPAPLEEGDIGFKNSAAMIDGEADCEVEIHLPSTRGRVEAGPEPLEEGDIGVKNSAAVIDGEAAYEVGIPVPSARGV